MPATFDNPEAVRDIRGRLGALAGSRTEGQVFGCWRYATEVLIPTYALSEFVEQTFALQPAEKAQAKTREF